MQLVLPCLVSSLNGSANGSLNGVLLHQVGGELLNIVAATVTGAVSLRETSVQAAQEETRCLDVHLL